MNPDEQNGNYWEGAPQDATVEQPIAPEVPVDPAAPVTPVASAGPVDNPVTWTAQEYIHPDKSPLWFIVFVIVVLGLIAVDVFVLGSWTFSALVVVMAVAVVIYTRRPPRTLTYALSPIQGLYVGEKQHHFEEFKAFGLIQDGEHHSIMLIPTKRFSPGVSVYFPEEAGEQIVDILGQRLPMEDLKLDIVDVIVRKLRL